MKTKTSTLTGPALNWAVAKCLGVKYRYMASTGGDYNGNWWWQTRSYSTDWSQGGPIIEREIVELVRCSSEFKGQREEFWEARAGEEETSSHTITYGPTPLIAAMRCFVASKLGDEVDVPEELT